jgi:hypothetical protein
MRTRWLTNPECRRRYNHRDLEAAANRLDQAAQIDKNSHTLRGRFTDRGEENEYKEKRRLARRLRVTARIFPKTLHDPSLIRRFSLGTSEKRHVK